MKKIPSNRLDIPELGPLDIGLEPLDITLEPIDISLEPIEVALEPLDITLEPLDVTLEPLDIPELQTLDADIGAFFPKSTGDR